MIHKNRFNFTFIHGESSVKIYCNATQDDAKESFQRRFGYWPEDAIWVERYAS